MLNSYKARLNSTFLLLLTTFGLVLFLCMGFSLSTANASSTAGTNKDGIMFNGQPFFPFGFFEVSWS